MHKKQGDDNVFYSYFDYLCKQKGVSANKACQEMGMSRNIAAKWKATNTNPNMKTLKRIAEYFDVSLDELLSHGEQSENATTESDGHPLRSELTKDEKELIDLFNNLNKSGKGLLLDTARAFVRSGIYTEDTSFVGAS